MRYYVGNLFYGESFLHYRTPGSKNGVRRYQYPDGSLTPEGYRHYGRNPPKKGLFGKKKQPNVKKSASNSQNNASTGNKRKFRFISRVSDEELTARIKRLKLENEYLNEKKKHRDLTKKDKKQMSEGKKHVLSCLTKIGETLIGGMISRSQAIQIQELKNADNEAGRRHQARMAAQGAANTPTNTPASTPSPSPAPSQSPSPASSQARRPHPNRPNNNARRRNGRRNP